MKIGFLSICVIFSFILAVLKFIGVISITWMQVLVPMAVWFLTLMLVVLVVIVAMSVSILSAYIQSNNKELYLNELNDKLNELEQELKNRKW